MTVEIILITHGSSVDNEAGLASGWFDTPLSATGEAQAVGVRERYTSTMIDAVSASDLERARRTAVVGFGGRVPEVPIRIDPRLREVDYGELTRRPRAEIDAQWMARVEDAHPGGESYVEAVARHAEVLREIKERHDGRRVLAVGSYASWMAREHLYNGRPLAEVAAEQREWQPGWRYRYE